MKTAFAILSQLKLNPEINPRHIDAHADVSDIKAQIAHKGCIGQLWVRAVKGGKFEILDGGRRFRAMLELAKDGQWKKDQKIPVNVFAVDDAEARDIALGANFPREKLSPADEAIGFTRLALSGSMKVADIAAHYAVSEKFVQQRIAIGSLPAAILASLRSGAIDIGAGQRFTTASKERALKVFKDLSKKQNLRAYDVAQALADGSIPGSDRRCLFVGAAAYEAAGGEIVHDLFSEQESWLNLQLLEDLFGKKIEDTAQQLKDEGWSWVEILRKNTHVIHSMGRSVAAEKRELTKADKAELKRLKEQLERCRAEMEALNNKYEEHADWSDADATREGELEEGEATLDAKIRAFDQPLYTARQMAKAGAAITCDEHGRRVEIIRGLIKQSAKAKANGKAAPDDEDEAPAATEDRALDYSDALTAMLESVAQKATKLAMVTQKPALTARMGLAARCLALIELRHDIPFYLRHGETDAGDSFARIRDEGIKLLKEKADFTAVVGWLETLPPEEITLIEAYLAADTFIISSLKNADVRAVIEMIDPDMTGEGWKPDLEFMGKLNRAQLVAVIAECDPSFKTPAAWKKAELVDEASGRAQATGWLPPPLRTPSYKGPGSNAWAEILAAKSAEAISQQQAAE